MTGKRASDAVTVAITGGLGNQMFQYAAGRALAQMSDPAMLALVLGGARTA